MVKKGREGFCRPCPCLLLGSLLHAAVHCVVKLVSYVVASVRHPLRRNWPDTCRMKCGTWAFLWQCSPLFTAGESAPAARQTRSSGAKELCVMSRFMSVSSRESFRKTLRLFESQSFLRGRGGGPSMRGSPRRSRARRGRAPASPFRSLWRMTRPRARGGSNAGAPWFSRRGLRPWLRPWLRLRMQRQLRWGDQAPPHPFFVSPSSGSPSPWSPRTSPPPCGVCGGGRPAAPTSQPAPHAPRAAQGPRTEQCTEQRPLNSCWSWRIARI